MTGKTVQLRRAGPKIDSSVISSSASHTNTDRVRLGLTLSERISIKDGMVE
jgi:hypothetical protein